MRHGEKPNENGTRELDSQQKLKETEYSTIVPTLSKKYSFVYWILLTVFTDNENNVLQSPYQNLAKIREQPQERNNYNVLYKNLY